MSAAPDPADPALLATLHAWVERSLGSPVTVETLLTGGIDARASRLDLADGTTAVMRALVGAARAWGDLAHDAAVLRALADVPLLPRLLAVDPTGQQAGTPAMLMSLLPGRHGPEVPAEDWGRELGPVLTRLEVAPVTPALAGIEDHVTRVLGRLAGDEPYRGVPEAAVLLHPLRRHAPPAETPRCLSHGDLWLGNVLWTGHTVTGVIDVGDAGLGEPATDRAVLRVDLAIRFGPDAADLVAPRARQAFWDTHLALHTLQELQGWWPPMAAIGVDIGYPAGRRHLVDFLQRGAAALQDPAGHG